MRTLRELEKVTKNLAVWKNHCHFNTRCLRDNITPKGLQLRSTGKGVKTSMILRKEEKKFLDIRLFQCNFMVNKLQDEKVALDKNLLTKLTKRKWRK